MALWRGSSQVKPPFWFKYHRIIQSVGLVVAIIAFILALSMIKGSHFDEPHHRLGLVVMILGILQPLNALIRPHPTPRTTVRMVRAQMSPSMMTFSSLFANDRGDERCRVSCALKRATL